jgi:hypothetical protein
MLSGTRLPRSKAFEDLVATSQRYLVECQERLQQEYLLGSWPRYDWSQVTRQLVFSDGGQPKVLADVLFVGSISIESGTWLWAWHNDSITVEPREAVSTLRGYGKMHGLPHLTTAQWPADEIDGWEMTSIAAFLLQAKGAYRSPDEHGYLFMIMTAVNWVT